MTDRTPVIRWDDKREAAPRDSGQWACSDRGWLFADGEKLCLGFYLDYGPDHYRSPHRFCRGACECELSEPGHVLAVAVITDPYMENRSRWCETIEQAKVWIDANHRLNPKPDPAVALPPPPPPLQLWIVVHTRA